METNGKEVAAPAAVAAIIVVVGEQTVPRWTRWCSGLVGRRDRERASDEVAGGCDETSRGYFSAAVDGG